LKEHEAGASVPDLARRHDVAENTIYRWKAKFGGMEVSDAKKLRLLEQENHKLKRLLAEAELDKAAPRARGSRCSCQAPSMDVGRWTLRPISPRTAGDSEYSTSFDDFTREYVLQIVDFSISGQRLVNELDRLSKTRRLPKTIVCDNGPELTSKAMFPT
jgi:putative transposase